MTTYFTCAESPLGPILLTSDGDALTRLYISDPTPDSDWIEDENAAPFPEVRAQLAEYFAGTRTNFDLPLAPHGTDFQKSVWDALGKLPYGLTTSYGELAGRLGLPTGSARAVGLANGKNPIWLIVPCHRIVGANGKLVGYAGGLHRKRALLDFEAGVLATGPQAFHLPVA